MLPIATDKAMMRREVKQFMQDTIEIYSVASTWSSESGETKTRTLVATSKALKTNPTGSERQLIAALVNEGTENIQSAKLLLPYGTTITTEYEVKTADGNYWQVVDVPTHTLEAATIVFIYRRLVNQQVVR
jgi:hypothetical protein